MSVIVQFPGARAGSRSRQHNRGAQMLGAVHLSGPGMISWVRPASCECCGRPTLARRGGIVRMTLCGECNPPNVA